MYSLTTRGTVSAAINEANYDHPNAGISLNMRSTRQNSTSESLSECSYVRQNTAQ